MTLLIVHPIAWEYHDAFIYCFGVDDAANQVTVKVCGFQPYFYVQIQEDSDLELVETITRKPIELEVHVSSYGYQGPHAQGQFAKIKCVNESEYWWHKSRIKKEGLQTFEARIGPVDRFLHVHRLKPHEPVAFPDARVDEGSSTYLAYEIRQEPPGTGVPAYLLCAFDIEAVGFDGYFPDAKRESDIVSHIALVLRTFNGQPCARLDGKAEWTHLLSVGPCHTVRADGMGAHDVFADETALLHAFLAALRQYNPDVFLSYNGHGFDWPYLATRLLRLGQPEDVSWTRFHRPPFRTEGIDQLIRRSTSHQGKERCQPTLFGQVSIDLYDYVIEQQYRAIKNNKLNTVALYFLNEEKDDIPITHVADSYINKDPNMARLVGRYCVQDTALVSRLERALHVLTTYLAMANTIYLPVWTLQSCGQQRKILNAIVRQTMDQGYLNPDLSNIEPEKYEGACVFPPMAGVYQTNVGVADFKSLYPSIIQAYRLDYTTVILDDNEWADLADFEYFENTERSVRFIQRPVEETILPLFLQRLTLSRAHARRQMRQYERGSLEYVLWDKRQLSYKLVMNASYGFTGSAHYLPCFHIAATVTWQARRMLLDTKRHFESAGHKVIYGDSIVKDEVVMLRNKVTGEVTFKEVQALFDDDSPAPYIDVKRHTEKEYSTADNYEVWSDQGFTDIIRVMRHKTRKRIYEVSTHTGVVRVTEDHSLLTETGEVITPDTCTFKTRLMSHYPPGDTLTNPVDMTLKRETAVQAAHNVKFGRGIGAHVLVYRAPDTSYRLTWTSTPPVSPTNTVIKIMDLGYTDDYVYDLETACGRFQAGVGDIIVKNTDSVFVALPSDWSLETSKQEIERLAAEVTATFPNPIELNYEKILRPFCIMKKKQYFGHMYEDPDKPPILLTKGVRTVRTDVFKLAQQCYQVLIDGILNGSTVADQIRELGAVLGDVKSHDVNQFTRTIKYTGPLRNPKSETPQHEIAKRMAKQEMPPRAGDYITYVLRKPRIKFPEPDAKRAVTPEEVAMDFIALDYKGYLTKIRVTLQEVIKVQGPEARKQFETFFIQLATQLDRQTTLKAFMKTK